MIEKSQPNHFVMVNPPMDNRKVFTFLLYFSTNNGVGIHSSTHLLNKYSLSTYVCLALC